MLSVRKPAFALAIICLAYGASPALAASAPSTRLVKCSTGYCLQISGRRQSATSEVRINDQKVTVEGERNWKARLPVEQVRYWAAPFARTIGVTLFDSGTRSASFEKVDLPIGFMGHTELASLVVGVN